MTKNLLVLGCSFTHQDGWANQIAKELDYSCMNLAVGSSSNRTQINRFNDFVLANSNYEFDAIWQITYISRNNTRLPIDHPDVVFKKYMTAELRKLYAENPFYSPDWVYADESPCANYFDNTKHMDILHWEYSKPYDHLLDITNELSSLLVSILMLKKLSKKSLIFFGDDVLPPEYKQRFVDFLQKYQINHIPIDCNLVAWARKNNLPFADDMHPTKDTYQQYAKEILLPQIK